MGAGEWRWYAVGLRTSGPSRLLSTLRAAIGERERNEGLVVDRPAPETSQHGGSGLAHTISNMVVRVLNEFTGRGPTQARTYIQDDLITVVLRDTLTRGERHLVEDG